MLGMIKIGEAAKRLGITTMELRDSAHRGEIKSTKTPGGVHYFREEDLEEFARKRRQEKQPEVLKIGEVAGMFGMSVSTIAGWADRGYLNCTRTAGGKRLFQTEEVKGLLIKIQGGLDGDGEKV